MRNGWKHLGAAIAAIVGLAADAPPANAQRVVFVDAGAMGAADGTSWDDAYVDLQNALDDVRSTGGCPCEIWVAAGVYKPDRGTGDRTMAFELRSDVALLGGFGGWEDSRDQRDPTANETILDGDLLDNDDEPFEASPCCQEGNGCPDPECFERVVEKRPSCEDAWGRLCAYDAIVHCCDLCRAPRCDNTFNLVRGSDLDYTTVLDGLTLRNGEATDPTDPFPFGAAVNFRRHGPATIRRCVFENNTAMAIYADVLTLTDSTFRDNPAPEEVPTYTVDLFASLDDSEIRIERCSFLRSGSAGLRVSGGLAVVQDCNFIENNSPNRGGGITASGPVIVSRCLFLRNRGSGIQLSPYGGVVRGSVFVANSVPFGASGGGISARWGAKVVNSLFVANSAGDCVFGDETCSGLGGAIAGSLGMIEVTNSTIVANSAGYAGGVWAGDHARIVNTILWANWDAGGFREVAQLDWSNYYLGSFQIESSIMQYWTGKLGGTGNSGVDPFFVDPLGPDGEAGTGDENLRLSPGSPAIDGGIITGSTPLTDLDGQPRVLCGNVDIGAYEFGIGDYDCDGFVELPDFQAFEGCMNGPAADPPGPDCAAFDFDANNRIDLSDYAAFAPLIEQ